jgi:hypothetical protein
MQLIIQADDRKEGENSPNGEEREIDFSEEMVKHLD